MPTTYMERRYYLQQSGSSRWLLVLEFMLCRHSDYGHSASLSHASQRERKDEKKGSEKNYSWLKKKNCVTSMEKQDDLVDSRGLCSEA